MNPLTIVKRIQNLNKREAALSISEEASWHAKYKDSAYVFVGGVPFDLTEGDLLAVFAQYGEIVDVNLVRDKGTGKSKGFAFVAYEDQRSTILAVDNLNGAQVLGRTIRVDHVSNYKKKEEEDEETWQRKREERGVCRAFQKGECTRGDGCKFSHDERRAADTGWGHEDAKGSNPRWGHDKFEGPPRPAKQLSSVNRVFDTKEGHKERGSRQRDDDDNNRSSRLRKDDILHSEKRDSRVPERQHSRDQSSSMRRGEERKSRTKYDDELEYKESKRSSHHKRDQDESYSSHRHERGNNDERHRRSYDR
ncbi:zinc finger CCCH domain-containing protein 25-like [Impatiens glandulifera]|uniref:zinc finger CCCH domain-containing protein 25-like n=1 Tax=Impatiens glandulifera TaxID=253017 RepID=UPI001FB05F20|nr:zinc finger CCCH domain-containing protein 25-like [Impatiens glandulifera]